MSLLSNSTNSSQRTKIFPINSVLYWFIAFMPSIFYAPLIFLSTNNIFYFLPFADIQFFIIKFDTELLFDFHDNFNKRKAVQTKVFQFCSLRYIIFLQRTGIVDNCNDSFIYVSLSCSASLPTILRAKFYQE